MCLFKFIGPNLPFSFTGKCLPTIKKTNKQTNKNKNKNPAWNIHQSLWCKYSHLGIPVYQPVVTECGFGKWWELFLSSSWNNWHQHYIDNHFSWPSVYHCVIFANRSRCGILTKKHIHDSVFVHILKGKIPSLLSYYHSHMLRENTFLHNHRWSTSDLPFTSDTKIWTEMLVSKMWSVAIHFIFSEKTLHIDI